MGLASSDILAIPEARRCDCETIPNFGWWWQPLRIALRDLARTAWLPRRSGRVGVLFASGLLSSQLSPKTLWP